MTVHLLIGGCVIYDDGSSGIFAVFCCSLMLLLRLFGAVAVVVVVFVVDVAVAAHHDDDQQSLWNGLTVLQLMVKCSFFCIDLFEMYTTMRRQSIPINCHENSSNSSPFCKR